MLSEIDTQLLSDFGIFSTETSINGAASVKASLVPVVNTRPDAHFGLLFLVQ